MLLLLRESVDNLYHLFAILCGNGEWK